MKTCAQVYICIRSVARSATRQRCRWCTHVHLGAALNTGQPNSGATSHSIHESHSSKKTCKACIHGDEVLCCMHECGAWLLCCRATALQNKHDVRCLKPCIVACICSLPFLVSSKHTSPAPVCLARPYQLVMMVHVHSRAKANTCVAVLVGDCSASLLAFVLAC